MSAQPQNTSEWRWFKHETRVWSLGYIVSTTPGVLNDDTIFDLWESTEDSSNSGVYRVKANATYPVDATHLEDLPDAARMNDLHEAPLLALLERRYNVGSIYTYTGDILISINPYGLIPNLYTIPPVGAPLPELLLPPHVFSVAERAYRALLADSAANAQSRNQSLIVSGESGAGKTEACKHVMRFLAVLSQRFVDSVSKKRDRIVASIHENVSIERKVLDCNPFLEAFGNAKTSRNDNSSRFGKFLSIQYAGGAICGARIRTFLLEKARVTRTALGERNYHIFYQLTGGASLEVRQELLLGDASDFAYLCPRSGVEDDAPSEAPTMIEGVDDASEFSATRLALSTIGISDEDQHDMWRVLAAILHLGNVTFRPDSMNPDAAAIRNVLAADVASRLLGCSALTQKLVRRLVRVKGRKSVYEVALTERQAAATRDALSKALYERLFNWLVARTNEKLSARQQDMQNFIGILDIFGFELFEVNSFEQLCINFANEKMQALFNFHIFISEQEAYRSEGVDISSISFTSNAQCIDLFENRTTGILSIIDEVCLLDRDSSTDAEFLEKIDNHHRNKHPFYENSRRPTPGRFSVAHFAGRVTYTVDGFLEKNSDSLSPDLADLLNGSSEPFVVSLFDSEGVADSSGGAGGTNSASFTPTPNAVAARSRAASDASGLGGSGQSEKGGGRSSGRTATILQKFRSQLSSLHEVLVSTTPHYIRCIKPNAFKRPRLFERRDVLQQLLYSGVLEAIRIRRQGFPLREEFLSFWRRSLAAGFALLLRRGPGEAALAPIPPVGSAVDSAQIARARAGISAMLEIALDPDDWRLGRSKVFLAYGAPAALITALRLAATRRLQAWARANAAKRSFRRFRAGVQLIQRRFIFARVKRLYAKAETAIVRVQAHARRRAAKRFVERMRLSRASAATTIGSAVLGWKTRGAFRVLRACAIKLQALARGIAARRKYVTDVAAVKTLQSFARMVPRNMEHRRVRLQRYQAALKIQCFFRGETVRSSYYKCVRAVVAMQARVRGANARAYARARAAAAKCITRGLRHALARIAVRSLRSAVVRLQAWWRGIGVRRVSVIMRGASIRITRGLRDAVARRVLSRWVIDLHAAAAVSPAAVVDAILHCKAPEYLLMRSRVPAFSRARARNWRDGMRTALHVAAARVGGDEVVALLLLRGASEEDVDSMRATAAHAAAAAGDAALPALKRLIARRFARSADAGVEALLSSRTSKGETVLDIAINASAACAARGGAPRASFVDTVSYLRSLRGQQAVTRAPTQPKSAKKPSPMRAAPRLLPSSAPQPAPPPASPDPVVKFFLLGEEAAKNRERAARKKWPSSSSSASAIDSRSDAVSLPPPHHAPSPSQTASFSPQRSPLNHVHWGATPARAPPPLSALDKLVERQEAQNGATARAAAAERRKKPRPTATTTASLATTESQREKAVVMKLLAKTSAMPTKTQKAIVVVPAGKLKQVDPVTAAVPPRPISSPAVRSGGSPKSVPPPSPLGRGQRLAIPPPQSLRTPSPPHPSPPHAVSPPRPLVPDLVRFFESQVSTEPPPPLAAPPTARLALVPPRAVPLITAVSGSNVLPRPPARAPPSRPDSGPRWIPVDSSTGARYYYDTLTGASSWDPPHDAAEPTPAPAPTPAPEPEFIFQEKMNSFDDPQAWTVFATREGRPYYVHFASNTTTWDIPQCLSVNPLRLLECEPLVPPRSTTYSTTGAAALNKFVAEFSRVF